MFYYALVDTNNICTAVYAMPAAISGASYVEITEALYNDPTLIGKKYVNGEWVEVTVYYYAILDDRNIVTNVYETATEMPAADNLVEITFAEYNDAALIGKYYDRANDAFIDPPVSVLAECSTNEIQYKNAEKYLSDKLDEMDEATAANTAAKHTHDNKEVLDGITAEKVAAWDNGTGGSSTTMTETEMLAAIKTVDGAGSGLDADTLDGMQAADFATAEHTHTGFAAADHTHNGYAAADHAHSGYAATDHTHTGYAAETHTHSGYASSDHTHTGYAASSHTHSQSEITGLSSALAGKAASNHTHSEYAANSHTHSNYAASNHTHSGYAASTHSHDYLPLSGGTVTGETNFSGGLVRVKGVQTLYHSGSQMVLASDNLATKICGNAITSSKSITVASDKRLKDDVKPLDKQALIDFIKKVELVTYRYKDESADNKHIGVIAQQLLEIDKDIAGYFVKIDKNGFYTVDYAALSLLAVLALQ